jgi:hypothetical protein
VPFLHKFETYSLENTLQSKQQYNKEQKKTNCLSTKEQNGVFYGDRMGT